MFSSKDSKVYERLTYGISVRPLISDQSSVNDNAIIQRKPCNLWSSPKSFAANLPNHPKLVANISLFCYFFIPLNFISIPRLIKNGQILFHFIVRCCITCTVLVGFKFGLGGRCRSTASSKEASAQQTLHRHPHFAWQRRAQRWAGNEQRNEVEPHPTR